MRGFVIASFVVILGFAGSAELLYQHAFLQAMDRLIRDTRQAHQGEAVEFGFMRFDDFVPKGKVTLLEDVFEAARVRVPRTLGLGSRLDPVEQNPLKTTWAYAGVDVLYGINGELHSTHTLIWSPRKRRFVLWMGECNRPGCPAGRLLPPASS